MVSERAVTVAQEYGDGSVVLTRGSDIGPAIPVEVADCDHSIFLGGGEILVSGKASVTLSKKHANRAIVVRGHDIQLAIGVEVARRD